MSRQPVSCSLFLGSTPVLWHSCLGAVPQNGTCGTMGTQNPSSRLERTPESPAPAPSRLAGWGLRPIVTAGADLGGSLSSRGRELVAKWNTAAVHMTQVYFFLLLFRVLVTAGGQGQPFDPPRVVARSLTSRRRHGQIAYVKWMVTIWCTRFNG